MRACVQVKSGGVLILDPVSSEEARREALCLMALMPSCNQVTQLSMQGEMAASRVWLVFIYTQSQNPIATRDVSTSLHRLILYPGPVDSSHYWWLGTESPLRAIVSTTLSRLLGRGRDTGGARALHGGLCADQGRAEGGALEILRLIGAI